jgi:HK97 family phage portal protein
MGFFDRFSKRAVTYGQDRKLEVMLKRADFNLSGTNETAIFCENLIKENVAQIPLVVYEDKNGIKQKAGWTDEYQLIKSFPNNYQTAQVFYSEIVARMLNSKTGSAYIQKVYDGLRLVGLYVLDDAGIDIKADGANIRYYQGGNLLSGVFHIPSPYGYDGVKSKSIFEYARRSVTLSTMLAEYLKWYLENSIQTKFKIKMPFTFDNLLDEKYVMTEKTIQDKLKRAGTRENAGKAIVEYSDVTVSAIDLASNKEGELSANRDIQDKIIARVYGVPYSFVTGENKYNSVREQTKVLVKTTLMPFLQRIEQGFEMNVIPLVQRGKRYVRYDYDTLLKADIEERYKMYDTAIGNGRMSPNEARRYEEQAPLPAEFGGDYFFISNGLMPAKKDWLDAYGAAAKEKTAASLADPSKGADKAQIDNKGK